MDPRPHARNRLRPLYRGENRRVMELISQTCAEFTRLLAGKNPVPGGGGAAALCAALGIALGGMVGSLTAGKKDYAIHEDELRRLMAEADRLREAFLALVEADGEAFTPFVRALGMRAETRAERAGREAALETARVTAAGPPLAIMEKCGEALEILARFAETGSRLAVSDAGTGAALCRAALAGASLNVYANTRSMKDRDLALRTDARAAELLARYDPVAERVIQDVTARLRARPVGV